MCDFINSIQQALWFDGQTQDGNQSLHFITDMWTTVWHQVQEAGFLLNMCHSFDDEETLQIMKICSKSLPPILKIIGTLNDANELWENMSVPLWHMVLLEHDRSYQCLQFSSMHEWWQHCCQAQTLDEAKHALWLAIKNHKWLSKLKDEWCQHAQQQFWTWIWNKLAKAAARQVLRWGLEQLDIPLLPIKLHDGFTIRRYIVTEPEPEKYRLIYLNEDQQLKDEPDALKMMDTRFAWLTWLQFLQRRAIIDSTQMNLPEDVCKLVIQYTQSDHVDQQMMSIAEFYPSSWPFKDFAVNRACTDADVAMF